MGIFNRKKKEKKEAPKAEETPKTTGQEALPKEKRGTEADATTTSQYLQVSSGVYDMLKKEGIANRYNLQVFDPNTNKVLGKYGRSSGTETQGAVVEQQPQERSQEPYKDEQGRGLLVDGQQVMQGDGITSDSLVPTFEQQQYEKDRETMSKLELQEKYGQTTYEDMPGYQKALLSAATLGVSSQALRGGGRLIGSATKWAKDLTSQIPALKQIVTGYVGTSSLMQWLASDNYVSTLGMYSNKMYDAVKWDGMDSTEAIDQLNNKMQEMEDVKKFTEINTLANPFLIPFRKLVQGQMAAAEESFMLDIQRIEQLSNKREVENGGQQ